jgi:hypothetical protein
VPLTEAPMRVLEEALRDPAVVARYRAKVLKLPGSYCCGGKVQSAVALETAKPPVDHSTRQASQPASRTRAQAA